MNGKKILFGAAYDGLLLFLMRGAYYDKFYLEHISCRWEWDYLRESIREETPQPRQGKLSPDIASTLSKLWKKRLAWDAEQRTRLHHRGEER